LSILHRVQDITESEEREEQEKEKEKEEKEMEEVAPTEQSI